MKKKIQVGERYGALKILDDLGLDKNNHRHYVVRCLNCGKISMMVQSSIKNKPLMCKYCVQRKDLSGQIIGDWKVLQMTNRLSETNNVIWACECVKCGTKKLIPTDRLSEMRIPKCRHKKYKYSDTKKTCHKILKSVI